MAKFHVEDQMTYYDAKLDKEDLNHKIELYREGYPNAKIEVSGDTIITHVEAGFALNMDMILEDVVTGEEIETDPFVVAEFKYTVVYRIDEIEYDYDIVYIEKYLNKAIESGQSTFLVSIPIFIAEVKDVEITEIEEHSLDKDLVERVGGESAIIEALQKTVMRDLCVPKDSKTEDYLHRLDDKVIGFYCTIREE